MDVTFFASPLLFFSLYGMALSLTANTGSDKKVKTFCARDRERGAKGKELTEHRKVQQHRLSSTTLRRIIKKAKSHPGPWSG